jgi:hypothetical protein
MKRRIIITLLALVFSTGAFAQYVTPAVNSPLFPSTPTSGKVPVASSSTAADWGVVGILGGGTGQTTASAAISALMPTPTRAGDVAYWNGSNWVTLAGNNSGTGVFSENSSGVPSWLTQAQLTALINLATASLSGALPAWPNNTTTFFRGDGTYAAVGVSSLSGAGSNVLTALGNALSANGGVTSTIASGATAMGTGAIGSGACASAVTATATNAATTDVITASFNADPTAVTGYIPSTNGMLTIIPWLTSGQANFKVCNNTGASITPGAVTINWRVVR